MLSQRRIRKDKIENGQSAIRQCQQCEKIFLDDFIGKDEFCSDKCEEKFNAEDTGDITDKETLQDLGESAKDKILGDSNDG